MAIQDNFFDIWGIFQNEVFGDFTLFAIGILVVVLIISLRNRMPFQVSIGLSVLWIAIISSGVGILWVLMVLFIVAFFALMVTRYFRRS